MPALIAGAAKGLAQPNLTIPLAAESMSRRSEIRRGRGLRIGLLAVGWMMTVWGQAFTVNVSSTGIESVPATGDGGGAYVITVVDSTSSYINGWSVTSLPSWLSGSVFVSPTGSCAGTQSYTYGCVFVAANSGAARSGVIMLNIPGYGSYGLNIGQLGTSGGLITTSIIGSSGPMNAIPATGTYFGTDAAYYSFKVTSPSSVTWSVTSNPTWIEYGAVFLNSCLGTQSYEYGCFWVPSNTGAARSGTIVVDVPGYGQSAFNLIQAGGCTPNLTNQTSTAKLTPTAISLPSPGVPYCDSTFGTQVMRISDDAMNSAYPSEFADYQNDYFGQYGFNSDATRLLLWVGPYDSSDPYSARKIFGFNPSTFAKDTSKDQWLTIWYNGGHPGGDLFWSATEPTILYLTSGVQVYRVDVTAQGDASHSNTKLIADLTSFMPSGTSLFPSGGGPNLERCSMSADNFVIACNIQQNIAPYKSIGYTAVRLTSLNPTAAISPANPNCTNLYTYINSSTTQYQTFNITVGGVVRTYLPIAGGSGGYKLQIDRSGRHIIHSGLYCTSANTNCGSSFTDVNNAPGGGAIILDTQSTAPGAFVGLIPNPRHGDAGNGLVMGWDWLDGGINIAIRTVTLSTLTTDPTNSANLGTLNVDPYSSTLQPNYLDDTSPCSGCGSDFHFSWSDPGASEVVAQGNSVSTNPLLFNNEIIMFNPTSQGYRRIAKTQGIYMSNDYNGSYNEVRPVMSPNTSYGRFVAFTSNWSSTTAQPNHGGAPRHVVMVLRIP